MTGHEGGGRKRAGLPGGHTRRDWALALVVALSGAALLPGASAQEVADRPDFNGIYFPEGRARRTPQQLPFTEGAAAMAEYWEANFRTEDEPGRFCIWPGMPRAPWGAPFPVEIFHRDYDISIYWEGYGMFRKIYMADKNPPEPILDTAMGYSLARWEGDTLVVETTNFTDRTAIGGTQHSEALTITERFTRTAQDTLEYRVSIDDPMTWTAPWTISLPLTRDDGYGMFEYACHEGNRALANILSGARAAERAGDQ